LLSKKSVLKAFTETRFYEEMNKKKLKNSLLIKLFDDDLKKDIKKLSKLLLSEDKLREDFPVRLCKGINPKETINGQVIYYIKQSKGFDKELITPVKENQVIIEIIKPQKGKNGRDCRGKIIKAKEPANFEIPDIKFDPKTIYKEETDEKILYKTKKEGYIQKEDDYYTVKDELEIKQINLKTGNVKNADDTQIKLDVKEKDVLKEAIADNMTVEAKTLIVRGNIGNKTKIKSQNLTIEGQTHKNSVIKALEAQINKHKGKLSAKKAEINSLEGGLVKANYVHVKAAIGGTIIGHRVVVDNLKSHIKIYALESIEIKNLLGEENLFSISPAKVLDSQNIEELRKKVEEIRRNKNIVKRELDKINDIIKKNKSAYQELKTLYLYNKEKNKKTDPMILMKLKEYKVLLHKQEKLQNKHDFLDEEEKTLMETIDNLQNAVYNAKIVSRTPWKAYNRIEFDLLEPPISLKYDTKGTEGICGFKLKFDGETAKIVKIKVSDDSGIEGKDT
jgi:uncharacterized protein (DUF342 family)